jgi:phosphoribosylglycinamide formyltransferase-1
MSAAPRPLRVAVLLSGSGTSLENLLERIDAGEVPARVAMVIASQEEAFGLERARQRDIPALAVPRRRYREVKEFNDRIHEALEPHDVDLVLLLGFRPSSPTTSTWCCCSASSPPSSCVGATRGAP